MAITRTRTVRIGTDETTGSTIANNATAETTEIDWLGGDAADAEVNLYLKFTSTVTAGFVDIELIPRQATGGAGFSSLNPFKTSIPPINGTQSVYVGRFPVPRYGTIKVTNNATGASATNVLVVEERFTYT